MAKQRIFRLHHKPVKYERPDSTNPLAYRFYNKDEVVAGNYRRNKACWSFARPVDSAEHFRNDVAVSLRFAS